ncbi:MAG: hypothetical protein N2Z70_02660 [Bdellovibrionaceae bacterium]|jgi:hypothetical protein|nr:hypothetical protein [Pseudobdellovibrionaceae bacterium]
MSLLQKIRSRLSQEWALTLERLRSQAWFQKAYNTWVTWPEKKRTWFLHGALGLTGLLLLLPAWSRWGESEVLLESIEEQRLMARALILSQKQVQDSDLGINPQSPEVLKSRINNEILQPEILPDQLLQLTQDTSPVPASLNIPESFIAEKMILSVKQLTVKQLSRILRNLSALAPGQLYFHGLHISQDPSMKSYLNLEVKMLALKYPDDQALMSLSTPEPASSTSNPRRGRR